MVSLVNIDFGIATSSQESSLSLFLIDIEYETSSEREKFNIAQVGGQVELVMVHGSKNVRARISAIKISSSPKVFRSEP